ncbi:hypothetical protein ACFL5Q_03540 [Planctomycetota bacterium]
MTDTVRPSRQRIIARRRRALIVALTVAASGLAVIVVLGFVATRVIHARENVDVYMFGSGVDHLEEGAVVAMGVEPIGRVCDVRIRDGEHEAHLAIKREYAEQIPSTSEFQVESLNHWMPGNLGVRVDPRGPTSAEPIRDDDRVQASNNFLPPEIPPKFYILLLGAALVVGATIALALFLYKLVSKIAMLVVLAIGLLFLIAAYQHFNGQITAPETPAEWRQAGVFAPDSSWETYPAGRDRLLSKLRSFSA